MRTMKRMVGRKVVTFEVPDTEAEKAIAYLTDKVNRIARERSSGYSKLDILVDVAVELRRDVQRFED